MDVRQDRGSREVEGILRMLIAERYFVLSES